MALLISLALFSLLLAVISYAGYRYYAKPGRIFEQIGAPVITGPSFGDFGSSPAAGSIVRVIRQIGEKMPVSPEDSHLTRRFLIAAGFRSPEAVAFFYGIKGLLTVTFGLPALFARTTVTSNFIFQILFVLGAAALGYFGPNFVLDFLVARRQEILKFALPDGLDLLVVCVEAGQGLDQALVSVARELKITHPELCEELELVNLEMRGGKRRADALRNLAERTGEKEIRKLVAILIQTDRFGTSMGESLRTHADYLRIRRRQEAEERANKVGVKLVFPIFFCILPAMLTVVGGPGILQIIKQLFPLMRQFAAQ